MSYIEKVLVINKSLYESDWTISQNLDIILKIKEKYAKGDIKFLKGGLI